MTPAESTRVIGFLAKVKIEGEIMKGHTINSLQALMVSPDPVAVRFCQVLSEAVNKASVLVLNEAAGIPAPAPAAPGMPQQSSAKVISESIIDHASRLMI